MDRRRALAFVVAGLGIVAIALAAATLTTPVMSDEDWRGGDFEEDPGDPFEVVEPEVPDARPLPWVRSPWMADLVPILLAVGLPLVLIYAIAKNRWSIPYLVGITALIGLSWLLVLVGRRLIVSAIVVAGLDGLDASFDALAGTTSATWESLPADWFTIVGVVLLGLIVLAIGLPARSGSAMHPDAPGRHDGPEGSIAAVGALGPRFDKNEVYRAWWEMASRGDGPAPPATPGRIEAMAIEGGLPDDEVRELTALFEAVRYGGEQPTTSMERRARRASDRLSPADGADRA